MSYEITQLKYGMLRSYEAKEPPVLSSSETMHLKPPSTHDVSRLVAITYTRRLEQSHQRTLIFYT